jgi:hypothetical protein
MKNSTQPAVSRLFTFRRIMMKKIVLFVLCVIALARALPAQPVCSSATIAGRFVYHVAGFANFGGGLAPTASLGTAVLEPKSNDSINVSITWSQSIGGPVSKFTGLGTATVKPDCTGTGTLTVVELNLPIQFEFVVLNKGNFLRMMPVSPAAFAVSATFERMSAPKSADDN